MRSGMGWLGLGLCVVACGKPSPPATTPEPAGGAPVPAPPAVTPETASRGPARLDALDDAAAEPASADLTEGEEPAGDCDWVVIPGKHIVPVGGEGPPRVRVEEGTICLWGHAIPLDPLDDESPLFEEKGCTRSTVPEGQAVRCPGVSWLFSGPASVFEGLHVTPLDD